MYSKKEINALFEIFKSGTIENIELALQLSKESDLDLSLVHFETLFDYLLNIGAFNASPKISLAYKIHQILTTTSLSITIKDTAFAILPASIYLLKNLKQLTIAAHVEIYVPQTISYFNHLEELEIYLLDQEKIPLSIFEISSLIKLDLSLNLFTELPREIWQLRNLEELNLLNCIYLHTIPNELFGLPKLKNVYLLQTLVNEISPSIAYSPIQNYVLEISSDEGKKLMATPKLGTKMLRHMNHETKWGRAFHDAMQSRKFFNQKIENIPHPIKQQGLNAIKEYFKGK